MMSCNVAILRTLEVLFTLSEFLGDQGDGDEGCEHGIELVVAGEYTAPFLAS